MKEKLRTEEFLPGVDKHFPIAEKLLADSGSGFMLPSGLSYVDFMFIQFLLMIKSADADVFAKHTKLVDYIDRVRGLPQLKEYVKSCPLA